MFNTVILINVLGSIRGAPLGMEYRGVNANPHLKIRAGRVRIPGLAAALLALVSHLYRHSFYVGYHLYYQLFKRGQ